MSFTDTWEEALSFTENAINNNPRFSESVKNALLDIMVQAYASTHGQWLASEKKEIAEYFNYLKNQFPSVTNDERFLNIFSAGADASATQADPVGFLIEEEKQLGELGLKKVNYRGVAIGLAILAGIYVYTQK